MSMSEKTKCCAKCKETKPLTRFHFNPSSSDGRHSWCKDCRHSQKRPPQIVDGKKFCPKCKQTKPVSEYHKSSQTTFGLQSYCKTCRSVSTGAYGRVDDPVKTCIRCKSPKDRSQFYGHRKTCRECFLSELSPRTRGSRLNSTLEKVVDYLQKHPCAHCGEKNILCLDFHHTDPSQKEYKISAIKSRSWEKMLAEIDKCEVLCSNCHRKVTAKQRNWSLLRYVTDN